MHQDIGYGALRTTTSRLAFTWAAVETSEGVYDWSIPDAVMTNLGAQLDPGTRVLVVLRGLPTWWETPGAAAAFLVATQQRYANSALVLDFGLLNEPNEGTFFAVGNHDPQRAADLFVGVPGALRAINPNSKIIGPCITNNGIAWYRQFMASGHFTGANRLDALSVNPYDDPNEPEHLLSHLPKFRALAAEYDLPMWATEYTSHAYKIDGVTYTYDAEDPTPDIMAEDEGASRVARAMPMFLKCGYERLYWYLMDLHVPTVNGAYSAIRGLDETNGYAMAAASSAMQYQIGLVSNWRELVETTPLWSWSFNARGGRAGRMMWRPAGQTGTVDLTGYRQVTDMYGATVAKVPDYALINRPLYAFD